MRSTTYSSEILREAARALARISRSTHSGVRRDRLIARYISSGSPPGTASHSCRPAQDLPPATVNAPEHREFGGERFIDNQSPLIGEGGENHGTGGAITRRHLSIGCIPEQSQREIGRKRKRFDSGSFTSVAAEVKLGGSKVAIHIGLKWPDRLR
jgi:hypothetical protein